MKKEEKKKSKSTQAQGKMFAYLLSLTFNQDFLDSVLDIRKKFSLPERGFAEDLTDETVFINGLSVYVDDREDETSFDKEVQTLAGRLNLTAPWFHEISKYILYDDFFFVSIQPFIQSIDVRDMLSERESEEPVLDWNGVKKDGNDVVVGIVENIVETFPVGIFISPHATRNDILDYVKKQYKEEIEPLQVKYREDGVKIGKARKRKHGVQERNAFICKNQHLTKKELVSLVNKEYGDNLEYAYINKIIREKCKKR